MNLLDNWFCPKCGKSDGIVEMGLVRTPLTSVTEKGDLSHDTEKEDCQSDDNPWRCADCGWELPCDSVEELLTYLKLYCRVTVSPLPISTSVRGHGEIKLAFNTQDEFERFWAQLFPAHVTPPTGPGTSACGNGWLNVQVWFSN